MANRSYLYLISNQPESYQDRPETVSGLSEWPYAIPFSYRVLMSGDPRLCSSLIADGFEDDDPGRRTPLYAISGEFEAGHARLTKLLNAARAANPKADGLAGAVDTTLTYLDTHRDKYLLLETIELDSMVESEPAALKAAVESAIDDCRAAGAAVDALPDDVEAAGALLAKAAGKRADAPLGAFHGLRLDDRFDDTRGGGTDYPLGLSWWTDVLYFDLWNRAEFEANA
jgi:hypothetical protein